MQQVLAEQAQIVLQNTFQLLKDKLQDKTWQTLANPLIVYSQRPGSHFTLNNALSAGKLLKEVKQDENDILKDFKSPAAIAQQIVKNWIQQDKFTIVAAGPFINITVNAPFLYELATKMYLSSQQLPPAPKYDKYKRIAIDFSSPNIAKDMHVGHICSTVIGDCIARTFEYLQGKLDSGKIDAIKGQTLDGVDQDKIEETSNYNAEEDGDAVFRINHIGDWGTQFGMLITYIQTEGGKKLQEYADKFEVPYEPIEQVEANDFTTLDISDLVEFYKKSRVLFDTNATFKKLSQLAVVRLQHHQPEETKIWQSIVEESRKVFNKIYKQLDIKLIEQGESFYNDKLQQAVTDCENAGLIEDKNGAKILDFHSKLMVLIVQKGDGGFGYDSTDLACIKYRLQHLKADRLIYITDLGQETHFMSVFEAAKLLKYPLHPDTLIQHCGFGVVCGPDGKRLKTRSGATVKLQDLLDEGYEKSLKIVNENKTLSAYNQQEKEETARKISTSAIKYAFLSNDRVKDMKFDFDKILSFKGNTACYMLYSYARICSIIRKIVDTVGSGVIDDAYRIASMIQCGTEQRGVSQSASDKQDTGSEQVTTDKFEQSEQQLMFTIMKKDAVILQLTETLQPYQLCSWMYQVALDFTTFYEKCRVISDGKVNIRRLQICEMARKALLLSFRLLGLQEVERM